MDNFKEYLAQQEIRQKEVSKNIVNNLSNRVIIINNELESKKKINTLIDEMYGYCIQAFEVEEVRTAPVYFKFNSEDEDIHSLQLRRFVTNLIYWKPFYKLKTDGIDATYIVDTSINPTKALKNFLDDKIIKPFDKVFTTKELNVICHDIRYDLAKISKDFNDILGLSINYELFIDLAKRVPRFNEIIRTKIPEGMQPNEIEAYIHNLTVEQMEILGKYDNIISPIIRSGVGIKDKQLAEFAINGGLKPDLDGNTIPIPINSNFVVGGLSTVSHYYIDAIGGRKSLILNKTTMGRSGHFSKLSTLLCTQIQLSDVENCNTVHSIKYEIKSKTHLKKIIGRYYRLPHNRKLKLIVGDEVDLIGQTIYLRSPATCALGSNVCHTCYGTLNTTNSDLNSIGGYAATKITEPVSQNILSSKHVLTTQSQTVEFNEEFYNFFSVSANEILLNLNNEKVELSDYSLCIITKNIMTISEMDELEFNEYIPLFHVKNKKTDEIIEMAEDSLSDIYLSPELKSVIKKSQYSHETIEIPFEKLDNVSKLFVLEIENNELTRPLYSIMNLVNRADHLNCETVDDMCQTFIDLLIDANIPAASVHAETFVKALVRDKDNVLSYPDYTKYNTKIQILTIISALEKNPSLTISLSSQSLKKQLKDILTYKKKDSSYIDDFYKKNLE